MRRLGVVGVALILVLGLGLALNWDNIGRHFGPSCTVAVRGTGATVTEQGWHFGTSCQPDCQKLFEQVGGSTACTVADATGGYVDVLPNEPSYPAVCGFSVNGDRVTVREIGALVNSLGFVQGAEIGPRLCADLESRAATGTSAPHD